jgi:hypothetical protein
LMNSGATVKSASRDKITHAAHEMDNVQHDFVGTPCLEENETRLQGG